MKPKVFIGSSGEQVQVAKAIQSILSAEACVPDTWKDGVFSLSGFTLESLLLALDTYDYAIFVMGSDDVVIMKDSTHNAVRDNILFELGLFLGRLGRERVYYVLPSGVDLHLPSDLNGLTHGKYPSDHPDLTTALAPFCSEVIKRIKETYLPEFPAHGMNGANVLSPENSSFSLGTTHSYSMHAVMPTSFALKVRLTDMEPLEGAGTWGVDVSSIQGWHKGKYDFKKNQQEFSLKNYKEGDLCFYVTSPQRIRIEYFKLPEEHPFYTKELVFE